MRYPTIFVCLLAVESASFATTIHVPADQPTIQAGIDAVGNGDTVLVSPGTYNEQFNFNGKTIVVRSEDGPSATTVLGSSINDANHQTVRMTNGEGPGTVLQGFTFRGGPIAIRVNVSATITQNVLTDQTYGSWAALVVEGPAKIINNTICHGANGGMACYSYGALIKNNIIAFNTTYGIWGGGNQITPTYNDVYGNNSNYSAGAGPGVGSISVDPLFVSVPDHDYHLTHESPCINAGDPNPQYNDLDGTRNDLGAYPFLGGFPVALDIAYSPCSYGLVRSATPEICWSYIDTAETAQHQYELQVGTDNDWSVAEQWATGPVITTDTHVTYAGYGLEHGSTYFIRIRVHNGNLWGDWREDQFTVRFISVIYVPFQQPTIQAGVDAAANGDTVLVAPGIYSGDGNRDISVTNKGVIVKSMAGPDSTIIDCEGGLSGDHRGFEIYTDYPTQIDGFLIRNGYHVIFGSAVRIMNGTAFVLANVIANCIFENNHGCNGVVSNESGKTLQIINSCFRDNEDTGFYGSGNIHIDNCTFLRNHNSIGAAIGGGGDIEIMNTRFSTNTAGFGGAIQWSGSLRCEGCTFDGNTSTEFSSNVGGGALFVDGSIEIINCTGNGNAGAHDGSFVYCSGESHIVLTNTIISYSRIMQPFHIGDSATIELTCCDIYGNAGGDWVGALSGYASINGNMCVDPLFCDTATNNYGLMDISPCAPTNNSCNQLIGAYGITCAIPIVNGFGIENQVTTNITFHEPTFHWTYYSGMELPEDSVEVAVGTDPEWTQADMWNPEPFVGPDTSIKYAGLPLADGTTYYLRLRVHNGLAWSEWFNTSFHMNSIPNLPTLQSPAENAMVATTSPTLWLLNSADAEGDSIFYDYEVYDDSEHAVTSVAGILQQSDSTVWTVDVTLDENRLYRWRTRAYDGFEYSDWTVAATYYVNASEEFPSAFWVYFPPDTNYAQVYDKPVEFQWGSSFDPDPADSVRYKLLISINPAFTFVAAHDSIYMTRHPVGDLNYSTHYWWKVLAIDTKGNTTTSTNTAEFWTWVLGDANGDRTVNVGDAVYLVNYVFRGGPAPYVLKAGDVNGDCAVNIGDAVYLISYVFRGGPAPKVGCERK